MSFAVAVYPRTGTLDADACTRFPGHVRSFLPFDRFSLGTIEHAGSMVVLAYAEGAELNTPSPGEATPIGQTLARYVGSGGEAVIRRDLATQADARLSHVERMAR